MVIARRFTEESLLLITLDMHLIPFGSRFYPEEHLVHAVIWSAAGGQHGYAFIDNMGSDLASGYVTKDRSGHRNPLHVLKAALADIDLSVLGRDYISTRWDEPKPVRMLRTVDCLCPYCGSSDIDCRDDTLTCRDCGVRAERFAW